MITNMLIIYIINIISKLLVIIKSYFIIIIIFVISFCNMYLFNF